MSNDPNKAMFEARMRGNKFGRFVNSQLENAKAVAEELDFNVEVKSCPIEIADGVWNYALEQAAINLKKLYPDNANTNAFCAAIRSMKK